MKSIHFLLPLVSSALADSLIKCPCNQRDCSKAADPCNCENRNIVNKYFCCDANTVPPKDLGLKDCENSTLTVMGLDGEHYSGICGGPADLSCADPYGTCNELSGPGVADDDDDSTPWGLCSHPRGPSHSPKSIGSTTMIVFSTSTASASFSNSPSTSTPSVPVSTSTVVETTTAAPSTLAVVTTTTTTTSTTPTKSTPLTLVVVTTTTTTSTTVKKSSPSTFVVVTTTTTTSTTSTKGSPSAISN